jgi:hypothetical protein
MFFRKRIFIVKYLLTAQGRFLMKELIFSQFRDEIHCPCSEPNMEYE